MKEFKTVAEQVAVLEPRGMAVGPNASIVLLSENYYSKEDNAARRAARL